MPELLWLSPTFQPCPTRQRPALMIPPLETLSLSWPPAACCFSTLPYLAALVLWFCLFVCFAHLSPLPHSLARAQIWALAFKPKASEFSRKCSSFQTPLKLLLYSFVLVLDLGALRDVTPGIIWDAED